MKRIFLAALMAGVASSAFAADLPTRKAPPAPAPYYAPAFTWTGVYVGINGGYGYGGLSNTSFGNPSGGFVGGTIGYNYQFGQFVAGVEGDLDWADLNRGNSFAGAGPLAASSNYKIDAMVTDRLRLGYAIDRALLYVTGGYAGMETKANIFDPNTGFGASRSTWRNGGVIGGGIEYAFTNNITAKAEYLYAPMEDKTYWSATPYAETNRLNVSLFRVGMNYKF